MHRCHKREFLLEFGKDRRRWGHWLFGARNRHGLCVLNCTVTSNHVHLPVPNAGRDAIPSVMRFVAGRTAQDHDQRKRAFWERRHHGDRPESTSPGAWHTSSRAFPSLVPS